MPSSWVKAHSQAVQRASEGVTVHLRACMIVPMARIHVFADEAGNFDFRRVNGASRYFILTTVACEDCGIAAKLLDLRRVLAWNALAVDKPFHASEDKQAVRDEVFRTLEECEFRVDATILDKYKAQSHLRSDPVRFYRTAWQLHFNYIASRIARAEDEMMVLASSQKTRGKQASFCSAVDGVVQQVRPNAKQRIVMWDAATDPGLQIADYCCWAIQRKWERQDERSYRRLRRRIRSEFDAFAVGQTFYY